MIRRPPRSTQSRSSAASDVYKRQANCLIRANWAQILSVREDQEVVEPSSTFLRVSFGFEHLQSTNSTTTTNTQSLSPSAPNCADGDEDSRFQAVRAAALAGPFPVSYTHLRAHETVLDLVCRLLLEKKKNNNISKLWV
eukprot:TRINITY_DN13010_c0_g1_i1.p1 TRINITY_DN13010_c0_g1~~TRINITY_DN13010_c0_g1_i1.p1  ORF type:complete len:139 (-),score=54.75 TRINITY_DN13010_c0_g1_i1:42-458(-)